MGAHHGKHVHLVSAATGKHVRVHDNGKVDANGHGGDLATWKLHHIGGDIVAFENKHNHHWLRIEPDGSVNGLGKGGEWCHFHVHHHPSGEVSLKSEKAGGHLGFEHDGHPRHPHHVHHGVHGNFRIVHGG